LLSYQGNVEEAITAYRQAIALKANYDAAHANLGQALIQLGRISEARTALEAAIRLAPRKAQYQRFLAELIRVVPGDPLLTTLEELARDPRKLPIDDQIELHFALGKAYDDLGRHTAAFSHFLEGNALKRRQIPYNEAANWEYSNGSVPSSHPS
jgi:tetratricopeptide (TPR) repeat protein